MKLLLLGSWNEVEHLAAALAKTDEFDIVIAGDVQAAIDHMADRNMDAVVLFASLDGAGQRNGGGAHGSRGSLDEILRRCDYGNPSVLLVVNHVDELDRLEALKEPSSIAIDNFLVWPAPVEVVRAQLLFMRRRKSILPPRQALLAALPDSMFRIRRDGTFIDYRTLTSEELSLGGRDIQGTPLSETMPPDVVDKSMRMVRKVLDSGQPGSLEYELPLADGSHSLEARMVPSGADEVFTVVRDVTARRRADAELRGAAQVKRAFASRVLNAQEAERRHLSYELHDQIGQLLLVHRMDAEWLAQRAPSGPVREAADKLCSSLEQTLELVRNLAMDLRPPAIDELGIGSATETLVANIARRSGLDCECDVDLPESSLSADVSVALYRIAQEALANAVRHARCERIYVSLRHDGECVELQVIDDGVGFVPNLSEDSEQLGIVGMRERAELVGGCVTIESRAHEGTHVTVRVPYVLKPSRNMKSQASSTDQRKGRDKL